MFLIALQLLLVDSITFRLCSIPMNPLLYISVDFSLIFYLSYTYTCYNSLVRHFFTDFQLIFVAVKSMYKWFRNVKLKIYIFIFNGDPTYLKAFMNSLLKCRLIYLSYVYTLV